MPLNYTHTQITGCLLFYCLMDSFSRKPLLCPWEAKLNYGNCVE